MTSREPVPDEIRCISDTARGTRCKQARVRGESHCITHLGGLDVARENAAKATRIAAANRNGKNLASKYRLSGPEEVIRVLEERLGMQNALAAALDSIVLELTENDELRYEGRTGEQLRAEVAAWMQLNFQISKLGADYVKIGLDERRVRLAELQAQILMGVIAAVLDKLELTPVQRRIAAVVVPQELERAAVEEQV